MSGRMKPKPPLKKELPKSLPSPEWLAGMVHQVFNGFSEEERQRRLAAVDMQREEALLYVARDILEFYDAAVVAVETRAGELPDPLRYEDVFTADEIANGVLMGTKTKRGWANIVTEQANFYRAKQQLVEWIDWLIHQTKEECPPPAMRPHWIQKPEVYGFGGTNSGKHWVAVHEHIRMPLPIYRVMRMKRDFAWYKKLAAWEAKWAREEKEEKKTSEKSLDRGGRQNSKKGRQPSAKPRPLRRAGGTKTLEPATRKRKSGT
jgi:hypothetical protein